MTEQQYRVIADRDKGDDPQWGDVRLGDRFTQQLSRDLMGVETAFLIRIERPVPTTDQEQGERIEAWHFVADHPVFKQCYGNEQPLIDSVLTRLNDLADMESTIAELAPSLPTREQIAEALYRHDQHEDWLWAEEKNEATRESYLSSADAVLALLNGADR